MGFRFSSSDNDALELSHEINVTPFIDVMLVLLIIFMVAAPLATVDVRVDLPVANASPTPRPGDPVYLTIEASGRTTVNDQPVATNEVGQAVSRAAGGDLSERIYLQADRTVRYEQIMAAMNALRDAGYLRVALVGAEGIGDP